MIKRKTFFDFCSGIGAGRIALENLGLTCVGHCEIDQSAIETYEIFFGKSCNFGDLMNVDIASLPDFDVMVAGFPCQTFSINGKRAGFLDDRGQIIFGLLEILKLKQPQYFILENVKGLLNHDKGRTISVIANLLSQLNYHVEYKLLTSMQCGIPQMRERVYFIGIKQEKYSKLFNWHFHEKLLPLSSFFDSDNVNFLDVSDRTFQRYLQNKYNAGKYILEELLANNYLVLDTRQSDLRLYEGKIPTLRTGRHGILYVRNGRLVKLSGYEALLFQGFPKNIAQKAKNLNCNKILSQAGNAMTVNVIQRVMEELLTYE